MCYKAIRSASRRRARRGRTGWSGNRTGSGRGTSPTSPEPAGPRSLSSTWSLASGSTRWCAPRRAPPRSRSSSPPRCAPKGCLSSATPSHHSPGQLQRQIGLPLIAGDHQRLSRRRTDEQLGQPQHRRQRRPIVRPRNRHQRSTHTRRERTSHDLGLEVPQPNRITITMPARDPAELAHEPDTAGSPIGRPTLE